MEISETWFELVGRDPTKRATRKHESGNSDLDGQNKNNQGGGTTDRPQLFQEADAVQAREIMAGDSSAGDCAGVVGISIFCARFACVFKREIERGACGA